MIRSVVVLIFGMVAIPSLAQILDDSTTLVYGPSTIKYYLLEDIKYNQNKVHSIDTGLYDMENFGYFDRSHRQHQDLGANGTALFPIWYKTPNVVGVRSGYDAYDPFFKDPAQFKYYNTKSPFIDLNVNFGGIGRSYVDLGFSRNVSPNWNVGFDITRLESDKQIGPTLSKGDKNVISTAFDLYSFYQTQDQKYLVLGHVQRFAHQVEETGGVYSDSESPSRAELFQYEDSPIKLNGAQNQDKRSNLHLYQEYRIGKILQLYHQSDFTTQRNTYFDVSDGSSIPGYDAYSDYYDELFLSADTTNEANLFRVFSNEVGIKGDIEKGFYSGYIKRRDVFNEFRYFENSRDVGEIYVGGTLRYDINENNTLGGKLDFLQTGDFDFKANVTNKLFEARYQITQYQPTVLNEQYFGNHYYWNTKFNSTLTNVLSGHLNLGYKGVTLQPRLSLRTIDNYVFFNEQTEPQQSGNSIIQSVYGLNVRAKIPTNEFKDGIVVTNEFKYSNIDNDSDNAIRLPKIYSYGKVYWEGMIFKRTMEIKFGVNLYFRSAYFGLDYNPVIQQFYLQNDITFNEYFVADVFFNFKVDKMRIFFKLNHLNQRNNDGYFVTPLYPGQQQVIDLGVKWQFFD